MYIYIYIIHTTYKYIYNVYYKNLYYKNCIEGSSIFSHVKGQGETRKLVQQVAAPASLAASGLRRVHWSIRRWELIEQIARGTNPLPHIKHPLEIWVFWLRNSSFCWDHAFIGCLIGS